MNEDSVIHALTEQVAGYQRLAKLAAIQHDHIQNARIDELLGVLQSRQEVLDQLEAHEQTIAPAKADWSAYVGKLSPADRQKADALLAETRALLEKITNADRNDVLVLQQRKLNIGKQIRQAAVARQVNRNYAAGAYGGGKSRMDVQM